MTREIPLSRGMVALVDDADYVSLTAAGPWHAVPARRSFYARHTLRRAGGYQNVFMHTVLIGVLGVDHINGNGLDNRRENLRPATPTQNAHNRRRCLTNTSGFKGVSKTRNMRWQASIRVAGHLVHLGTFDAREQAARAYDAAALTHFGEFARLNFPQEIAS